MTSHTRTPVADGSHSKCWWCQTATDTDVLHRLDSFTKLGGYAPHIPQSWMRGRRICENCALLFAQLRIYREMELIALVPH